MTACFTHGKENCETPACPTMRSCQRPACVRERFELSDKLEKLGEPGYVDALQAACNEIAALLPNPPDDFDQVENLPDWVKTTLDALRSQRTRAELHQKTAIEAAHVLKDENDRLQKKLNDHGIK